MSMEAALYYEAVNTAAIAALISTRFYPVGGVSQEASRPYATYQLISRMRHGHQGGVAIVESRVQVNCVGDDPKAAEAVAAEFVTKFSHYRADMGESGSTVRVLKGYVDDESDNPIAPSGGGAAGPHVRQLDLVLWHEA